MSFKHYPSLDGLRGIAVIIVLVAHSTPLYVSGAIGVDIFFVLSGYLITSILLTEIDNKGNICLINFYIRRFLRLIPALWLTVVLLFGWLLLRSELSYAYIVEMLFALTYTSNWVHALELFDRFFLGHTWSLAMEEQFYLLWPLVLMFGRLGKLSKFSFGVLLIALSVLVAVVRATGDFSAIRVYRGLDLHCDGLLLGGALASFQLAGLFKQVRFSKFVNVCSPVALCLLVVMPIKLSWSNELMIVFGYTFVALLTTLIICDQTTHPSKLLSYILNISALKHVGKVSYGLYLYHWPILVILKSFSIMQDNLYLRLGVWLVMTVALTELSYRFIERPILALKRNF